MVLVYFLRSYTTARLVELSAGLAIATVTDDAFCKSTSCLKTTVFTVVNDVIFLCLFVQSWLATDRKEANGGSTDAFNECR